MKVEQAYLGTLLKENYLINDSGLKASQFEQAWHIALFASMKNLVGKGNSVDIATLSIESNLESFGGASYINDLISLANPQKVEEYEQLVLDAWKEREKKNILSIAKEEDWEIAKVISSLDAINEVRDDDHTSIADALVRVFEAPWKQTSQPKGVLTGIKRLDDMTNGFQNGELTIVAARPSMGKSDVMLHFAKQAGWNNHLPLIFSLEMPEKSLTDRLIASTGGINRMKMRDPYKSLTPSQKENWSHIVGRVTETNIQIFDGAGQTVAEMRAKARKQMHQYPDKKPILIIDYMTLIRPLHHHNGNANAQVTEISRDLKGMAKEFNCPVVVLSQLSRKVDERADKRPFLSDIRDSGSVEQDADVVMFLYREKYYDKDSDNKQLEIIVAKQRNGPIGTVSTIYNEFTGEILDAYHTRAV
ncbi:replicative DNA helicase [Lederbergia galactosidilyticus]|uniref:replicative DNA helicase n=1 Tax=Lederbergia galactosidilytica TaxID=217031 RepID=UPI001D247C79|nr:DnaB-like helicase C-terminal domain-containing protein [Lederbergia galactosidilytica]MBP1917213.1 replicative DNA helicase [Lederbergia galactosidilytica]